MTDQFASLLNEFETRHPDEKERVNRFRSLLELPDAFVRTCRPGHFTASALVFNPEKNAVLLVEHKKLGFWVQPGGHADGDTNLDSVARRETFEETGIENLKGSGLIVDLDIHAIPARKDETGHDHYDVRFLYIADKGQSLIISEESTDLKWVPLNEMDRYSHDESLRRMIQRGIDSPGII